MLADATPPEGLPETENEQSVRTSYMVDCVWIKKTRNERGGPGGSYKGDCQPKVFFIYKSAIPEVGAHPDPDGYQGTKRSPGA